MGGRSSPSGKRSPRWRALRQRHDDGGGPWELGTLLCSGPESEQAKVVDAGGSWVGCGLNRRTGNKRTGGGGGVRPT
jgi:hypothetical protein